MFLRVQPVFVLSSLVDEVLIPARVLVRLTELNSVLGAPVLIPWLPIRRPANSSVLTVACNGNISHGTCHFLPLCATTCHLYTTTTTTTTTTMTALRNGIAHTIVSLVQLPLCTPPGIPSLLIATGCLLPSLLPGQCRIQSFPTECCSATCPCPANCCCWPLRKPNLSSLGLCDQNGTCASSLIQRRTRT